MNEDCKAKSGASKRFHVHVAVKDIAESVSFYTTLFAAPPSVQKEDYAKWMLDDPRINFAISKRGREAGLDHLGLQVESDEDLHVISNRLKAAGDHIIEQEATTCCYAQGNKAWVHDPQGIAWETFHTTGSATVYGEDLQIASNSACCAPGLDSVEGLGKQCADKSSESSISVKIEL
ncbi:MAG: VOC family protein [Candidatus Obscuribacterales bacterium]|nr:VOC family protein [Candidatus Obscuribacterales bacterium]